MNMQWDKTNCFQSMDLMWTAAVKATIERGFPTGSRDGECLELLNFHGTLIDPGRTWLTNPLRAASPTYGAAELLWYLSGEGSVTMLTPYAPSYGKFAEDGGIAYGAYGARIRGGEQFKFEANGAPWAASQLEAVTECLRRKGETRQAVVVMWRETDLPHAVEGDKKDLPCTLTLQFIARRGELSLTASMRSNDAWLGMPYDVWCFTAIQRLIAESVGLRVGPYHHQAGSFHLYKRNHARAFAAMNLGHDGLDVPQSKWNPARAVNGYVEMEAAVRRGSEDVHDLLDLVGRGDILSDCVALCADKHIDGFAAMPGRVHSQALRAGIK